MTLKAAVIGAGRIGALLDDPNSPHILTHAHGYKASEGFEIVGFVDRELGKAQRAATCWGGKAFSSIEELFARQDVDVVSVCVPDELHYETLSSLAKRPVRLIFLEKPPVRTATEAESIGALYARLPIRVLVNYTRRFVPEIRRIGLAITDNEYGDFLSGTGYYGKGLMHNGSHMVDLVRFLLGEVDEIEPTDELADFYDDDPSVSALLSLERGGRFYLKHIDCRNYDIFELDLLFEKKRVRISDLGAVIEEYSVGDNKIFKDCRTLNKDRSYSTEHRRAMYHAITNIRSNLERDEPLACTLQDSLATVTTCLRISQAGSKSKA
ncbi:MAG: Gfo/Idh/MocA family oxidoreductase [Ktedonobacteraceae bacterium]|nr:Gfo/Idh/MocA family oxidoreductase [Ktedonobacteraceae bacterium]